MPKPPEAPRRRCPRREAGQARPLPAASPSNPSAAPPVVEAIQSPACARPRCTAFLQTGPAARGRCRFTRLSVGYPQAPQGHPLQQRLGTLQRRACPDPLRLTVKLSMCKDQKTVKTSTTQKPTSSSMNNKEASPSFAVGRSQRPDLDPLPAAATCPAPGKGTKHGFSYGKFVWWHSHVAAKSSKTCVRNVHCLPNSMVLLCPPGRRPEADDAATGWAPTRRP